MSNFEHIDDYLTNRLNAEEKANFEKQLESDDALRADVEFQKLTIEAIKNARAAQLKSMLNNVPLGSAGVSGGFTAAKIAGGVIAVALISGITYLYLNPDSTTTKSKSDESKIEAAETTKRIAATEPGNIPTDRNAVDSIAPAESSKITKQTTPVSSEKANQPVQPVQDENQSVTPFKEPKIEVLDLSNEVGNDRKEKPLIENRKPEIAPSRVEVSTDSSNKKYAFHYQFSKGKLMLYGSFDKGLYEILEINGNSHNVFLFYQANYYLLEEKDNVTSPLEPVKDPVLLKKLKEYRTR